MNHNIKTLTNDERLVLLSIARSALTLSWGSEEQVELENKFYLMCEAYGLDIEECAAGYCCKATTRECMEYCLTLMDVSYSQEEFKLWESQGNERE